MTAQRDNVLLVHWHDLGRYLGAYGHPDVSSPRLDQLAAEGILFTRAHATAPLCSPSRGSLFTGRYPQSNGLVGLAHHGWEYRAGVRTLPHILSEAGWHTALFGMQHETSYPSKLGFDEFDVSNSYCEYVVEHATHWLAEPPEPPFLLTAGFFETHRPYPRDRYDPADAVDVVVPDYLPDTGDIRQDLAEFYGSISVADAAVGRLLDTLDGNGTGRIDLGGLHDRPRTGAAARQVDAVRRRHRHRDDRAAPAEHRAPQPQVYDELFSGVDLLPTLLDLLGLDIPADVDGMSHARNLRNATDIEPVRTEVYTTKTYHDSFDPIRAIRTKEYSYIENYASRPLLDLPWDIAESAPGRIVAPLVLAQRPERELYDLVEDPTESHNLLGPDVTDKAEAIANDLALLLNDWRQKTNDVIPSEFAGTRIAERYTETYLRIHGPTSPAARRSPRSAASKTTTVPDNSFTHGDCNVRQCQAI